MTPTQKLRLIIQSVEAMLPRDHGLQSVSVQEIVILTLAVAGIMGITPREETNER